MAVAVFGITRRLRVFEATRIAEVSLPCSDNGAVSRARAVAAIGTMATLGATAAASGVKHERWQL